MVMFEKNGQGYFDFDFKELSALTSERFAKAVQRKLSNDNVKKVQFEELNVLPDLQYIRVIVYTSNGVTTYDIQKGREDYIENNMLYIEMQEYLEVYESGDLDG